MNMGKKDKVFRQDLMFRMNPVKFLMSIPSHKPIILSDVARKSGLSGCYSHMMVAPFKDSGLITTKKKGRCLFITKSDKGRLLSNHFSEILGSLNISESSLYVLGWEKLVTKNRSKILRY